MSDEEVQRHSPNAGPRSLALEVATEEVGPDVLVRLNQKQLARIIDRAMARIVIEIPCCHISGEHDPTHFKERRYVCTRQKAAALDRLAAAHGLRAVLSSERDCYWCHESPNGNAARSEPVEVLEPRRLQSKAALTRTEETSDGRTDGQA